ncbi:Huntingtin interacting protein E-like protein [Minicystis rosea]|nr:Huntingtin interacting protein E-like protein [Minicystis rosea]
MDLPMAAKKTRKPSKTRAAKPARRSASRPAAKPKKGALTRAKAKAARKVAKAKARQAAPKARAAKPVRKPERAAKPARKPEKAARRTEKAKPRKAEKPARKVKASAKAGRRAEAEAPKVKPSKREAVAEKAKPSKREAAAEAPKKASKAEVAKAKPSKREAIPEARASKRGTVPSERRSAPGLKPSLKEKGRGSSPPSRGAPLREPPARLVSLPLPILTPTKRPSIEERAGQIEQRLAAASPEFRKRYEDSLDMSWIYHDSALEGVVYTFEELRTALSGQAPPVTDSSLQPTYDDIRRHKESIEYVRELGQNKKVPVTIDDIKKFYLILHPEEGDIKTVKYRKDIPQHRLYFHEYAPPDKIAYKVRQIVEWLNDPETRKTRNGIRIAARAHYDLLRVYPFPTDSGKVSRLFMNLLLIRAGLPPSIIHSTERQRYYEALKGSATTVLQMVQEAVENALSSVEKLLDEYETKKRAFVS